MLDPVAFSILVLLLLAAGSAGIFLFVARTRMAPYGITLPDEASMHYRLGWSGGLLGLAVVAQAETMRVFGELAPSDPVVLAFLVPGVLLTCTGLTVAAQVLWNQPHNEVTFPKRRGFPARHAWGLVGGVVFLAFILAISIAHAQVGRLDSLLQSPGDIAATTVVVLISAAGFFLPQAPPALPADGSGRGLLVVAGVLAVAALLILAAHRLRLVERLRLHLDEHLHRVLGRGEQLPPDAPEPATSLGTDRPQHPARGVGRELDILAEDLDTAVEVYDPESDRVDYVSPGSEALWGLDASTLQGSRDAWTQAVHPDDRDEVLDRLGTRPGPGIDGEYRVVHPDGGVRWVRDRVVAEDPDDPASRLVRIAEDVTGEKESEVRAIRSEERYRALVEQAPDLIATFDPVDWSLQHVNGAVERILGYRTDEWDGGHFLELVHPHDRDRAATLFESLADGAYPDPVEVRVRHRDGTYRFLDLHGVPVKEDGHVVSVQGIARDVTDRVEAEERLRESEERIRQLTESIDEVLWLADADLQRIHHLSPQFEAMWGIPADHVLGNPSAALEAVHPEDLPRLVEAFQEAKDGHLDVEFRVRRSDGEERWLHARGYPAGERDGSPCIAGATKDVTEERRLRRELEESEVRWRALVEQHPDHIVEVDREGRILYANNLPEHFDSGDLEGRRFSQQVPAGSRGRVEAVLDQVVDTGEPASFTIEGPVGGVDRVLDCRAIPLRRNGSVSVLVSARDVTEQRKRDRKALLLKDRMDTYLETTYDMLFTVEPREGRYTSLSSNVERIMGWPRERLLGRPFGEFVHPEDLEAVLGDLAAILAGEAPPERNVRVLRPDGSHTPVSLTGRPVVRDGEVVEVFGIGRVVGEGPTAPRRELQHLERHSQDLRALARASAHHLQEPVRNIVRFAQLLERDHGSDLPKDVRDALDHVVGGTRRLREVSDGLNTYLEVTTRHRTLEAVDLQLLVEDVVAGLSGRVEATGAEVTVDPAPTVLGDPRDLRDVIHHLLDNALRFHGHEPPRVHVGFERQEDLWVMAVRDEGVGIDPAHHERVFHPLRTLHHHSEHAGAGLGLAKTRYLVEALGGNVWVDSREGEGATFYVALNAPGTGRSPG